MPKASVFSDAEGYVLYDFEQHEPAPPVRVGSDAWFQWLQDHRSFSFEGPHGHFNAQKERVRERGWYWKAYRRLAGRRLFAYLGRSEGLTGARLEEAAAALARDGQPADDIRRSVPRTKLFVPAVRPGRVVRQRLFQRLRAGAQFPATVVVAPAGYGKTTLVADWIRTDGRDAAWVSLDAADNSPNQFWALLGAALDSLQADISSNVFADLRSLQQRPNALGVMSGLVNDLATELGYDARGRPRILVMDDWHEITDPDLVRAVHFLVEHLPLTLRVVITTRAELNLPLAHWRVHNLVSEVRTADLAFNHAETKAFLNTAASLALSDDAIDALEHRTEGWIAAMQLAALSLRHRNDPGAFIDQFHGSRRDVMNYLMEQVVRHLPAQVQDMLMRASVLDRMCDDLCHALMGPAPTAALPSLRELSEANLFLIPLDDEGKWYRFHQLLADALRARMNEIDAGRAAESHRRAARWFETAGLPQEAIQHAIRARDLDYAARLIEGDISTSWERHSIVAPSAVWVEQLPDEWVRPRAVLVLARIMSFLRQLQFDQANAWLDGLDHLISEQPAGGPSDALRARAAVLRAYTVRMLNGDMARAMALSAQALELMPEHDHIWRGNTLMTHASLMLADTNGTRDVYELCNQAGDLALKHGNHELYAGSLYLAAMYLCYGGRLRLAEATLAKAQRMIAAWNMPRATSRGWRESVEMKLAYERNDLAALEQIAQPALARAVAGADHIGIIGAVMHLVRAHTAQGRSRAALDVLDAAESICAGSPLSRHYVAMLRANVSASQGDLTLLEGWVDDLAPMIRRRSVPRIPSVYDDFMVRAAHAYFQLGRLEPARQILDEYQVRLRATEANDTIIRLLALRALVLDQHGDSSGALEDLRAALALAKPEGYVRSFVDYGAPMRNLLLGARAHDIEAGYVMKLLAAFEAQGRASASMSEGSAPDPATARESAPWVEAISSRERDVLRLLSAGHTNQVIADELGITVTTVKSHTGSIYSKLGVRNRTQAVARGRELGLLS